ncbi:hypothetical protein AGMMS49950_11050 [Endomicrobiia bacterium]|nr:hypothetical protein AGMMS49950_11050 [Endomicrobiia bacterium]
METIKRKSKMGELLTIMLKTRLEKIVKKVMTAIIVFGMVISPAVNAMAKPEPIRKYSQNKPKLNKKELKEKKEKKEIELQEKQPIEIKEKEKREKES